MDSSSPLLRFEPGLMFWSVVTFVVLLLVLRKIASILLLPALDDRKKRIRESLDRAQKTQWEAERVTVGHQRHIAEAIQKAEEIVRQARHEAEQVRQQILKEARVEADRIIQQGMRRLEAEQRSALQEIRGVTANWGDSGRSLADSSLA